MEVKKLFARALENWPAKALSVVLAIMLFVYHRTSSLETRFFTVPLTVETKGSMMPSSSIPRIRISLRGDYTGIHSILNDDIEAYIDMTKYEKMGIYQAPVQWRKKGTALGVEPLEIHVDPAEVSVSLDYRVSKVVPLTANMRGHVEQGYALVSSSLNPTQVLIDGPSELLGSIAELSTDFIDLDGRTGDFSVMVNILKRDPLIAIRGSGTTEFRGFVSKLPEKGVIDANEKAGSGP